MGCEREWYAVNRTRNDVVGWGEEEYGVCVGVKWAVSDEVGWGEEAYGGVRCSGMG